MRTALAAALFAVALLAAAPLSARPHSPHSHIARLRQHRTLEAILERVGKHRGGVVQLDLDTTTVDTHGRAIAARDLVLARHEVRLPPEATAWVPLDQPVAFSRFLMLIGAQVTAAQGERMYREFSTAFPPAHGDGYLADALAPGLVRFVEHVIDEKGSVAFNTRRRRARSESQTLTLLHAAGLRRGSFGLYMRDSAVRAEDTKGVNTRRIEEELGPTLVVIDDLSADRETIARASTGDPMRVPIVHPGRISESTLEALARETWLLSTFESP